MRDRLGFQVPAVFWRFKTDESEAPGPEQADYEYEEKPEYPQDMSAAEPTLAMPETSGTAHANTSDASDSRKEDYDVRHLARKGMEVAEISMGEFDEFLKGTTAFTAEPQ